MQIDLQLTVQDLRSAVRAVLELAGTKVRQLERRWDPGQGAPVFTVAGKYTTRGWTQWTQGFQYGCALLAFEGTGDTELLDLGREHALRDMALHVTHTGVHDHGFNNLSTYGNLRRLMREGRTPHNPWEWAFYEMALKCSGAVQAARWAPPGSAPGPGLATGGAGCGGYIYSFNGPHSLFIDTMRSLRVLGVAHQLGHALLGENDRRISLLGRLMAHAATTAEYNIYYGQGRDGYDRPEWRGRTAQEVIFNRNDGRYRCPSTQQGYSPFSTWTRGLAWGMVGFAEELEFLAALPEEEIVAAGGAGRAGVAGVWEQAARATCDFYLGQAAARDGVCYWDTGAPGLAAMGDYLGRPADPFNEHEPVDASAAAIAAQGLLRLGRYLGGADGGRYTQAGLTVARTLLAPPYLAVAPEHEGLLLHSVYHRPNGWDYLPAGRKVPCGEASMWGDYHLLELAVLLARMAEGKYLTFFDPVEEKKGQSPQRH